MKRAHSLEIYIASSAAKNFHAVQLLRRELRHMGHTVLDWTTLTPPLPDHLTPDVRKAALDSDECGEVFTFCTSACASADLVIYLGPAGQDASCEVGIAFNAGVPVFGLAGLTEQPGVIMHRAVSKWFSSVRALLVGIEHLAEDMARA